MAIIIPVLVLAYVVLYAFAFSVPPLPPTFSKFVGAGYKHGAQEPLQDGLEAWLRKEEDIALEKLLANISPGGRNVQDAAEGSVIASPSREHPDYYFQWVRDAAITMSTLVDVYASDPSSGLTSKLSTILDAYATLQSTIQHTSNPSGTFSDLSGLGEPKFLADGSPFTGSWGRPQRDGPALRAITLMSYLRAYNASHPSLWSSSSAPDFFQALYDPSMPANSIIKADLEYVSHFWNQSGFDLWEEVQGLHFFTAMVQLRALREGADLALAFGDVGAKDWYTEQGTHLEKFMTRFWDEEKGHLVQTLGTARTGLDCGLLLGSLHGLSSKDAGYTPVFPPWSDEVLISLLDLVEDQRDRFPINAAPSSSSPSSAEGSLDEPDEPVLEAVGLGRYPEDIYDGYTASPSTTTGANPWFLCTASASSVLYATAAHLASTASLTTTPLNLRFYAALLASSSLDVAPDSTYGPSDAVFHSVLDRLTDLGDGFLDVVRAHEDVGGSLSEQFDKRTGFEKGASDLSWSYGAVLGALRARKGL